ncbi:hypothetical protein [Klebsiella variicola]|uniref:hypothetical protein n=1 Tax=Klebsiella TaxID=570 RepID=UPI000E02532C|nr:hypothetical protein [Klebsiella variicola]HBS2958876.1 hypothetical protein [Klebsiella variicola subsp. variicola]ELA2963377.1 hypothetical protein [Klebsiella variicola]WAT49348.1 hypothetical protein OIX91_18335 [Klebsiella variicola]WAT56340.1 hypothetical protein OIX89_26045 [Klebsiella variicola]WBD08298.1 hypothetical protein OPU52_18335 [Klebsiella variicola]
MSDIKEIASSLKDALLTPVIESIKFRAKNNFFGSFILSWLFWNWEKIVYFIFSKDDILKKIHTVKLASPFENENQWHLFFYSHSLILPLASAIIFTFSYPFFIWFMSFIHKWILNEIHKQSINNEIKNETSNKALVRAKATTEFERDVVRGETELSISENRKKSSEINYSVDELIKKHSELTNTISSLEAEEIEKKSIIKSLNQKHQELTSIINKITDENLDLVKLNEKYSELLARNLSLEVDRNKAEENSARLQARVTQFEHDTGRNYTHFEPLYNELAKEQSNLKDTIKRLDTFIDSNTEIKKLRETSKTFDTLISDIIKISK